MATDTTRQGKPKVILNVKQGNPKVIKPKIETSDPKRTAKK